MSYASDQRKAVEAPKPGESFDDWVVTAHHVYKGGECVARYPLHEFEVAQRHAEQIGGCVVAHCD